MVDEERIKELEAIDRKFNFRRKATVVFFVFLSFLLVIYAVSIERKITRLSQSPAVVVYRDATSEETETEASVPSTITTDSEESAADMAEKSENPVDIGIVGDNTDLGNDEVAVQENVQNSQIYYVTATGKKYHKAGCSYLTKSKREVTYDEIISGGYSACSRCFKE